jgi:hypothetical protein
MNKHIAVGIITSFIISIGLYQYSMDTAQELSSKHSETKNKELSEYSMFKECLESKGLSVTQSEKLLKLKSWDQDRHKFLKGIIQFLSDEKRINRVEYRIINFFLHSSDTSYPTSYIIYLLCFDSFLTYIQELKETEAKEKEIIYLIDSVANLISYYHDLDSAYQIDDGGGPLDRLAQRSVIQEQIYQWYQAILLCLPKMEFPEEIKKRIIDTLVVNALTSSMYIQESIIDLPFFYAPAHQKHSENFYYSLANHIGNPNLIRDIWRYLINNKKYNYARSFNQGLRNQKWMSIDLFSLIYNFELELLKHGEGPAFI